jgi:hypothetical protein
LNCPDDGEDFLQALPLAAGAPQNWGRATDRFSIAHKKTPNCLGAAACCCPFNGLTGCALLGAQVAVVQLRAF